MPCNTHKSTIAILKDQQHRAYNLCMLSNHYLLLLLLLLSNNLGGKLTLMALQKSVIEQTGSKLNAAAREWREGGGGLPEEGDVGVW